MVTGGVLARLYDGVCSVFELAAAGDGLLLSGAEEKEILSGLPCHLAFERLPAADAPSGSGAYDGAYNGRFAGSNVAAAARLFLPAEHIIEPGSLVRVRQNGREYRLQCSGLAAVYRYHQEIAVELLDERA